MNQSIPEDLVDATWQEVSEFSEEKALREMNRLTKAQPALTAFVMARSEDLSHDARELGIYMLLVISRMFEKQFGKLKKADIKTVRRLEEECEDGDTTQPFVLRSVEDCLFDPADDGIKLTEEDQETLFAVMKVVIGVLAGAH